jgi:hypothetical protein
MRCATKCAVCGNTIGKEGERCLNDQFTLWSRVEHIWCDEQL